MSPAPQVERLELPVGGMTCAACQAHVERSLRSTPGVSAASVNLVTRSALVDFDPSAIAPPQLVEAVRKAGYEADLPSTEGSVLDAQFAEDRALAAEARQFLLRAAGALSAAAVLMVLTMPLMGAHHGGERAKRDALF